MDRRPDESWTRLRGTGPFRPHPLRDPGRDLQLKPRGRGVAGRGVNGRAASFQLLFFPDRGGSTCSLWC